MPRNVLFDSKRLFLVVTVEPSGCNSLQDIRNYCKAEREKNKDSKVFVLCILSHGESGVVFGIDGNPVQLKELETCFDGKNCTQLVERPKLFLIQACQGG